MITLYLNNPPAGFSNHAEYREPSRGDEFLDLGGDIKVAEMPHSSHRICLQRVRKPFDWEGAHEGFRAAAAMGLEHTWFLNEGRPPFNCPEARVCLALFNDRAPNPMLVRDAAWEGPQIIAWRLDSIPEHVEWRLPDEGEL